MAINQDYSLKDTKDVYEELLDAVDAMTTKWNPRNSTEADPGVVILKLMALLEDKNNYKSDMARNQGYLDTVVDRESAYDLLEMLGYTMRQARCATGTVTLTVTNKSTTWAENVGSGNYVSVPRFTILTDASGTLSFFTLHDLSIAYDDIVDSTGKVQYVLDVQAGEPFQITKDGVSTFSLKDIDEDGRLYLGKTNLAQNGVFVYTYVPDSTDSTTGTEVDNSWTYLDFAILKPTGNWYTVHTSADSETYIQFPDDFEELIGSLQFVVYGTYTDGAASNIDAGLLSCWDGDTYKDYLSITQSDEFTNGQDEESIETASDNYYATKDVCDTLVSAQDYESAIKYLIVQLTSNIKSSSDIGERYFSNVVVRTGQDRRTKVRTAAFGVAYDLYMPDRSVPSTQVDVIALQSSTTYTGTFLRYTSDDAAQAIKADVEGQLQDNVTLDVDIELDATYPRILAVTTPEMIIRVQNYSTSSAATLRTSIREYFEATYSADNLVPGEELDIQTIMDDIKKLSSDILSVSMDSLTYTTYLSYSSVDGASETTLENGEFTDEVLARAALSGDVPMFKFYNRQNTTTKQSTLYSAVASVSEDSSLDTVLTVPLNAQSYSEDATTLSKSLVPKIVDLRVQPTQSQLSIAAFNDDNDNSVYSIDTGNYASSQKGTCYGFSFANTHVLQFRKPLHTENTAYSYGMKWLLYGKALDSDVSIETTTELGVSTILAAESVIITSAEFTDLTPDSTEDGYNTYTLTAAISIDTLSSGTALAIQSGSLLKAGSKIAIGSTLNGSTYYPVAAEDGDEYLLKNDETLVFTYSDGTAAATYTAGTWIQPSGVSLSFSTNASSDSSTLSTTATISILANDSSTITDEYVYFLSLRKPSGTDIYLCYEGMLDTVADDAGNTYRDLGYVSEYMLEDDELFVYADVGITEYVSLGPGTVLRLPTKKTTIHLVNTPYTTLDEILATDFRDITCDIEAQSYELTTYLYKDTRALVWGAGYTEDGQYPEEFTPVNENYPIYVVLDATYGTDSATTALLIGGEIEATFDSSNYETRLAVNLECDSDGVLELQYPVAITLEYEDTEGNAIGTTDEKNNFTPYQTVVEPISSQSGTASTDYSYYLISSTTYSAVHTAVHEENNDDPSLLLVPGATARISVAVTKSSAAIGNSDAATVVSQSIGTAITQITDVTSSSSSSSITSPSTKKPTGENHFMSFALPIVERELDNFTASTEEEGKPVELDAYTILFRLIFSTEDMDSSFQFAEGDKLLIYATNLAGDTTSSVTGVRRLFRLDSANPLPVGNQSVDTIDIGTIKSLPMIELDLASTDLCGTTIGVEIDPQRSNLEYIRLYFVVISADEEATYADFAGLSVTVTDLSYVLQYADEFLANSEDVIDSQKYDLDFYSADFSTNGYSVLEKVRELDTEGRYDYLTMPTEAYSNPTLPASYFESSHPYNSVTFPYIEFSSSKIKIIKGR